MAAVITVEAVPVVVAIMAAAVREEVVITVEAVLEAGVLGAVAIMVEAALGAADTAAPGTGQAVGMVAAIAGAAAGTGRPEPIGASVARLPLARPSASSARPPQRPGPARRPALAIAGIIPTPRGPTVSGTSVPADASAGLALCGGAPNGASERALLSRFRVGGTSQSMQQPCAK